MDKGVRLGDVRTGLGVRLGVEARTWRSEVGSVAALLLWQTDTLVSCYCDGAVGTAVSWVIPSDGPLSEGQLVHMDVIQPNIIEVLATDDEQFVRGDGRQVGVARFGNRGRYRIVPGRNPAVRGKVEEPDVVEDAEVFRVVGLEAYGHASENDEVVVP